MPPTPRRLALASFVALLVTLAPAARGAVILPVDVETLARRADTIVRGTALDSVSSLSDDGRLIHTVTRVRVVFPIKGAPPAIIQIRTPGGTVGNITQTVSGMAEVRPGEEVILFLRKAGEQRFAVEGHALGKFEVVKAADGAAHVRQNVQGLGVLGPNGVVRPAPALEPVSETEFLHRVRRALATPVGR